LLSSTIHGIHKHAVGKAEKTAERVPGHVVAIGKEDSAVSDNGKDHEHNKGEETHACFEGGVVTGELKEDRDHVNKDKDCGSACSGHGEKDEHSPRLEKLH
jgi:hypothetical protein